jgi:hypothetical protein
MEETKDVIDSYGKVSEVILDKLNKTTKLYNILNADNRNIQAFAEVYDILKHSEKEIYNKIPSDVINCITNNMDKEYKLHIDYNININKQNLLSDTRIILSLIYRDYLLNEEELKIRKKHREIKKPGLEDIEKIFKERNNISNVTAKYDKTLPLSYKIKWYKKIFVKILNLFSK